MARTGSAVEGSGHPIRHRTAIRFKGETGEQATMFFYDPSGNALEFKAFANDSMLFAT